jgi:hypothetical protein
VLAAMEKLTATGCKSGSRPDELLTLASSGKVLTA